MPSCSNFLLHHYYSPPLQQIQIHHRKICASGSQCQEQLFLIIKTQSQQGYLTFDKFIALEVISFHVNF